MILEIANTVLPEELDINEDYKTMREKLDRLTGWFFALSDIKQSDPGKPNIDEHLDYLEKMIDRYQTKIRSLPTPQTHAEPSHSGDEYLPHSEDMIDLAERGRATATMPTDAGSSSSEAIENLPNIDEEYRRDSAADKIQPTAEEPQCHAPGSSQCESTLQALEGRSQSLSHEDAFGEAASSFPANEPRSQSPENLNSDPALQDLEWTSQPPYCDADFDAALNTSPSSSQRTAIRYRNDRDDASISTASSERKRSMFKLNENARQWDPFQAKSTASIGISGGYKAMGKMSLREAVSPTRKGRRSVTEHDVSDALKRIRQNTQLDVLKGKGKALFYENRSPRALFDNSSEFDANHDDDREDILWRSRNLIPQDEDADLDPAVLPQSSPNIRHRESVANNFKDFVNSSSPPTPERDYQDLVNENVSPLRRMSFANPVLPTKSASEAIDSTSEHKRTSRHKRSTAVDLTRSGPVQRGTGDTSGHML